MFKVVIAGSRDCNNYTLMKAKMNLILKNYNLSDVEIVSGGANGADKLGERFADENNIKKVIFKADWDNKGKSAGYIRNWEMAKYADACVVFMKKEGSKGSQHMIDLAKKENIPVRVITY